MIDLSFVPMLGELSDNQWPTPEDYTYWQNRSSRIFTIDYEIEEDNCLLQIQKIIMQLNYDERNTPIEELKKNPIVIQIFTCGGEVSQSYMLIDTILTSRIPVITVNAGLAMSAGLLILLAGHKRYAFPHSQTMYHRGYLALDGTVAEVEDAQNNAKRMEEVDKKYILERSSIPKSVFNKTRNRDIYYDPENMVKYGIVHGIVKSLDEVFKYQD